MRGRMDGVKWALAAFVLWAGCDGTMPGEAAEILLTACTSNGDCAGGEVCREGGCRTACAAANECAAPLPLCDNARGYCVECIEVSDCKTHQTCEASFCRFFCRDNSACAADQYCVRAAGECAPRECETARDCSGGFRCEGFACVAIDAIICEASAERCSDDATTVLRCNADGTTETPEVCDASARCVSAEGAAACREQVCTPNARGCVNTTTAFACDATGTARTESTCSAGESCANGSCSVRLCTDAEARCSAGSLTEREVCAEDGLAWLPSPCDSDETCVDGACLERLCMAGALRCVDGSLTGREVCAENGLSWVSSECGSNETCMDGTCFGHVCTAGESRCVDGSLTGREVCAEDGLSWLSSACESNETCTGGICIERVCAGGTSRCVDGSFTGREVCADDGLSWLSSACGSDESCTEGTCEPHSCTPNETECANSEGLRECLASGLGYSEIVSCSEGESCEASACAVRCGDGVVGGSEECDDGNTVDGDGCSATCQYEFRCRHADFKDTGYMSADGLSLPDAPFTIEAWVRIAASEAYNPIISFGSTSESVREAMSLRVEFNALRIGIPAHNGVTSTTQIAQAPITPLVWHHVAYVYLKGNWTSGDSHRLYVDGREFSDAASDVGGTFNPFPTRAPTTIGAQQMSKNRFFRGQIAQLRVSSGARYSGDFTPPIVVTPDATTVALWAMDEGEGPVANDSTASERHATLVSDASLVTHCLP